MNLKCSQILSAIIWIITEKWNASECVAFRTRHFRNHNIGSVIYIFIVIVNKFRKSLSSANAICEYELRIDQNFISIHKYHNYHARLEQYYYIHEMACLILQIECAIFQLTGTWVQEPVDAEFGCAASPTISIEINRFIIKFGKHIFKIIAPQQRKIIQYILVDDVPAFVSSAPFEYFAPWHIFSLWQLSHVDRTSISAMHRPVCPTMAIESPDRIRRLPIVEDHSMVSW